jgi:4-phosphopantoate---beta-alanine ligase
VALAKACHAQLEVNIFHTSAEREQAICRALLDAGADTVLMPTSTHALAHIDHNRRWINPEGIAQADVVFVPLEDGDRCQALVKNGKTVITVDLNPLSRTANTAQITIVDHLLRCIPLITQAIRLRQFPTTAYDNAHTLQAAVQAIRSGG